MIARRQHYADPIGALDRHADFRWIRAGRAKFGLLDKSVTLTPPAGAAGEMVSVRFCVVLPLIVRLASTASAVAPNRRCQRPPLTTTTRSPADSSAAVKPIAKPEAPDREAQVETSSFGSPQLLLRS